jgi:hypothetical protein
MKLLLIACLAVPHVACVCGHSEHLALGIGASGAAGITTPLWGETMSAAARPVFTATFAENEVLPGPAFELFLGTTPIPLTITEIPFAANPNKDGSCPHHEQTYDVVDALGTGSYTLVHRGRIAAGHVLNCLGECPWTTFEGERALVLTLEVGTSAADAGVDASR